MDEMNILYMESVDLLQSAFDMNAISFMESSNDKKEKASAASKSKMQAFIDKIKKMWNTFKEKIAAIFRKRDEKKIEEAGRILKENPALKNKKIKVKDYEKREKELEKCTKKIKSAKTKRDLDGVKTTLEKIIKSPITWVTATVGVTYITGTRNKKKIENKIASMKRDIDDMMDLCLERKTDSIARMEEITDEIKNPSLTVSGIYNKKSKFDEEGLKFDKLSLLNNAMSDAYSTLIEDANDVRWYKPITQMRVMKDIDNEMRRAVSVNGNPNGGSYGTYRSDLEAGINSI